MAKIMVVDDEADVVYVVRKILEKDSHEVVETYSGSEALAKLESERPDLILLDVTMPNLDGWEVCRRIKSNDKTKSIPVAMLTVKTEDEDKITSLDAALADWHISKPINEKKLNATVRWLLTNPLKRGK